MDVTRRLLSSVLLTLALLAPGSGFAFGPGNPPPGEETFSGGPLALDLVHDRIRHGWTQTELARRSGVRLETISRIESGKHTPRRETLLKLDRALSGR